ncbi:MAG: phosphoadenylyl-sulfate reductase [Gammaproteobacteria bacterium]|nr:phosphoadenylyl-sulfate reductase [Gammaproteobacteria bacterium]
MELATTLLQASQPTRKLSADNCIASALLEGDLPLLNHINQTLELKSARQRIIWALENLPGEQALSSSFGIQSAVMLHLITEIKPDMPVILIDTGYLFDETYQFIDELSQRLQLNLYCFQPQLSPAWQEVRSGKLWLQGKTGIERYNQINKVEPMQRALITLNVTSWLAGLRREQSSTRKKLPVLSIQQGRFKFHPIIDWHKRDVHRYLTRHKLPYHPLWEKGYVSVGDYHTSQPLQTDMSDEQTRFFGLQRECGLHV